MKRFGIVLAVIVALAAAFAGGFKIGRVSEHNRYSQRLFLVDPALIIQYEITRVDVAQSSDLGCTQGNLSYTMTDPKTSKPINRSKWLTIRKKQVDESWKIVQDAWNSDLPLPSTRK